MKHETLFSHGRFVQAVVNSSGGQFRALPLQVNPADPDCRMHAIEQRCRFGRRRVQLGPFGLYASPGLEDEPLERTLCHLVRQLQGIRTIDFVWNVRFDHQPLAAGLAKLGISATQSMTHVLWLQGDYESAFSGYNAMMRNHVRRAQRDGVSVRRANCSEDIRSYYSIHRKLALQKGGYTSLYPIELFHELLKLQEDTCLLVAEVKEVIVAGGVFFRDGDSLLYWHGASDREYSKMFPACAVLDYAVRSACREKLSTMNFGASAGIASLEQFKSFWGAKPEPCWHFQWRNPLWGFVTRVKGVISTNA